MSERVDTLSLADSYWDILKGLGRDVKLVLIARLSSSLVRNEDANKYSVPDDDTFNEFCGAWVGEESVEEINAIIKDSRKSKDETLQF